MDEEAENALRTTARFMGPALVVVGLWLFLGTVAAMERGSFYDGQPRALPAFGGVIFIGVGGAITRWAFLGPAARYAATETAPAVAITAGAVAQGLAGTGVLACAACKTPNEPDAKFCKRCATALRRTCAHCRGTSAGDARFCDDCGKPFPA